MKMAEDPNQFEDFKTVWKSRYQIGERCSNWALVWICPGFDSISCPCLNSIGKSLCREEFCHRDYLDTSLGSGNAKLAKYRMTYLRRVSSQPFS